MSVALSQLEPSCGAVAPGRVVRKGLLGFTLIELMVVVLIMGILATIGVTSFRSYFNRAKTTEAVATCASIGAAQERYRTLHGNYLDVSQGDLSRLYPTQTPGKQVTTFWGHEDATDNDWRDWVRLAPEVPQYTQFGYATVAGLPGDAWPNILTSTAPTWPANVIDPWFVVRAQGDLDGDGQPVILVFTSFDSRVYKEGFGE